MVESARRMIGKILTTARGLTRSGYLWSSSTLKWRSCWHAAAVRHGGHCQPDCAILLTVAQWWRWTLLLTTHREPSHPFRLNNRSNHLYRACFVFCVLWGAILNFQLRARSASARSGTEITEISRSLLGACPDFLNFVPDLALADPVRVLKNQNGRHKHKTRAIKVVWSFIYILNGYYRASCDNLCLWRCIAVHRGMRADRSTQAARELVKRYFKLGATSERRSQNFVWWTG